MEVSGYVEAACQTDDTSVSSTKVNSRTPWYKDKRYQRYWKHHSKVSKWFHTAFDFHRQNHYREYYRKMAKYHIAMAKWMKQMESYYVNWYNTWLISQQPALLPHVDYLSTRSTQSGKKTGLKRRGSKQWRQSKKRQRKNSERLSRLYQESEQEQFEMEITPDMLDFFRHSAKHKKERDAKKKEQKASEDERIDIGDVNAGKNKATVLPPSDRPGFRRTTEMRLLYGKGAAMIHGMETAMQLNYDRNCDLQQPKLWPQLPINIKFT